MNGELVREKTKDDLFNASRRIADLAPDDRKAVETAYLTVLTRRPTPKSSATSRAARGDQGPGAEGPAHRPLLDPAEHDGILVEPLSPSEPEHEP